eukprot:s1163_g12.t1
MGNALPLVGQNQLALDVPLSFLFAVLVLVLCNAAMTAHRNLHQWSVHAWQLDGISPGVPYELVHGVEQRGGGRWTTWPMVCHFMAGCVWLGKASGDDGESRGTSTSSCTNLRPMPELAQCCFFRCPILFGPKLDSGGVPCGSWVPGSHFVVWISGCKNHRAWTTTTPWIPMTPGRRPSAATTTASLASLGRRRKWRQAVQLLQGLRLETLEVNLVHCNAAINSCILCWLQAAQLLGTWCSRGQRMDVISCNTMTTALEKGSLWQAAQQLLSKVPVIALQPDAAGYNAATAAVGTMRRWEGSVELLGHMQQQRVESTVISHAAVLSAEDCWTTALDSLQLMRNRFISPNLIHYNSVTSSSGSSSSWQITLRLLAFTGSTGPDTIGFNAGISGVALAAAWRQVAQLLTVMKGCGTQQDVISFNAALTAVDPLASWRRAAELLRLLGACGDAVDRGLRGTLVSLNSALSCCGKAWLQAISHLSGMLSSELLVDSISLNSAMSATTHDGIPRPWRVAMGFLKDFQSSKLRCSVVTFGAALSGELMETPMPDVWPQGLWLLRAMTRQVLRPSVEAQNSVMSVLANLGLWRHVIEILWTPSSGAALRGFGAAMDACGKALRWRRGMEMLGQMRLVQALPNSVTFHGLVACCQKRLKWHQVLQLRAAMEQGDIDLNQIVVNAVIAASEQGNLCADAPKWLRFQQAVGAQASFALCEVKRSALRRPVALAEQWQMWQNGSSCEPHTDLCLEDLFKNCLNLKMT